MGHFLSRLRKCCHKAEFAIWSHRFFLLSPSSVSGQTKQEGKANYDGFAFFFFLLFSHTILLCARSIRMVWCHFDFSLDRALAFVLFKNRPKRPVFFCAHFSPSVLPCYCSAQRFLWYRQALLENYNGGLGDGKARRRGREVRILSPTGLKIPNSQKKKKFQIFHLYPFKPQV